MGAHTAAALSDRKYSEHTTRSCPPKWNFRGSCESGFRVPNSGFKNQDSRFKNPKARFKSPAIQFTIQDSKSQVPDCGTSDADFRSKIQDSRFKTPDTKRPIRDSASFLAGTAIPFAGRAWGARERTHISDSCLRHNGAGDFRKRHVRRLGQQFAVPDRQQSVWHQV